MRPRNTNYVPEDSLFPFQGIDYDAPSTLVDPHFSPDIQNMDIDKGHLRKRRGFQALGGAINGTPLAIFEFETLAGVTHLILLTTTKEYKYNTGTGAWDDITYATPAAVVTNRTGNEDNGIDYVIVTGLARDDAGVESVQKWVIITNGVDKPRYWDGTLARFYEYSTATIANKGARLEFTGFTTMKTISSISSYLVMGNVSTGSNEPTTVVWTDTGSLWNWGTGVGTGGNSGAIPITDATGPIVKAEALSDRLMLYSEDSIHAMYHVGGNDIFAFEKLIGGTRLVSPRAIVNVRGFHLFLTQENIQLFDGSRQLRVIADKIAPKLRDELASSLRSRAWAFLDIAKNQVYWGVPSSEEKTIVYKMEYDDYDVTRIRWTRYEFDQRRITAMGFWRRSVGIRWNDSAIAAMTWQTAAMNWNQGSLRGGFPQRLLGYGTSVAVADDTTYSDGTTIINGWFDTIDFTVPRSYLSEEGRWIRVELELQGSLAEIYYSVDRGGSWVIVDVITLTSQWERYKLDFDVVSDSIRFRILNANRNGFEMRFLRVYVTPASR
jgi:hypothetical protein